MKTNILRHQKRSFPFGLWVLIYLPIQTVFLLGYIEPAKGTPSENQVNEMLDLLKGRPKNLSIDKWFEQRREAARELGRLKESRAVPHLLNIISKERFDVILEIAIESLGEIGDKRAKDPLIKLLHDPSLDSYVRDAAAEALEKLKTTPTKRAISPPAHKRTTQQEALKGNGQTSITKGMTSSTSPPRGRSEETSTQDPSSGLVKRLMGVSKEIKAPRSFFSTKLDSELIAVSETWNVAAGTADLEWNGGSERTSGGISLQSDYKRQIEKKHYGTSLQAVSDVVYRSTGVADEDRSWHVGHTLRVVPEGRFYPFQKDVPLLFGQAFGDVQYHLSANAHPAYDDSPTRSFTGKVRIGGGPGYGRLYNMGSQLRLKRMEEMLIKGGIISSPMSNQLADNILFSWFQLRNRIGNYHQLKIALQLLQDGGLMHTNSYDLKTIYQLVRILDDPQMDHRPQGLLFRFGYGYDRDFLKNAADPYVGFLYGSGEYIEQTITHAMGIRFHFDYGMVSDPDVYSVATEGFYSFYLYNAVDDPLGTLSTVATLGASSQPGQEFTDGGLGYRALLGVRYSRFFNRGTAFETTFQGGYNRGAPTVLVNIAMHYGIAQGSFAAF